MTPARWAVMWMRAAAAIAVIIALAAGVPWLLVAAVGNPYPSGGIDWASPVTDATLLGLLSVLAWIFWTQFVLCLVVEVVAEIRTARGRAGDWLVRMPGTFTGQQQLARALVNALVTVGVGASTAASSASASQVLTVSWASGVMPPTYQPTTHAVPVSNPVPGDRNTQHHDDTRVVTVAKGDTLWSLAERYLGSGERWRRLADLNDGRLMPDGAHFTHAATIRPGWTLLVPGTTSEDLTVAVRPGDTLWGLAQEEYGEGRRWHRLYASNRDRIADPDVIHPGQVLEVPRPGRTQHHNGTVVPTTRDGGRVAGKPPHQTPHHRPTPTSPGPVATPTQPSAEEPGLPAPTPSETPSPASHDTVSRSGSDSSLAALLTGGGALLAASALTLLAAQRRGQMQRRRAGRAIAAAPTELVPTERALREAGSLASERAAFLDRAVRDLSRRLAAVEGGRLPDVSAAHVDDERLDLLLGSPASCSVPPPWVSNADGDVWSLSTDAPVDPGSAVAPYPTLASLGIDKDGGTWLIDLEAAKLIVLHGDPERCLDLARFLAAELAVNVWSDDVTTIVSGLEEDLVGIHPERLRLAAAPPMADLMKTARRVMEATRTMGYDVLDGRLDGRGADTFMPTVLIAAQQDEDPAIPAELRASGQRHAVATVLVGQSVGADHFDLTVTPDGTCTLEPWGVTLRANALTADEAADIAALLDHAYTADDQPMPAAYGTSPVDQVTDVAGSLRPELVEQRSAGVTDQTLLPASNEVYVAHTAAMPEDLAALAPVVPHQVSERVLQLDPSLDADLADWNDPDCPRPKIRLLGPVEVTAQGERTLDVDRRLAYYTELVAYLATRDHGATPEQTADAFDVQTNSIHSRIGSVRKWLGVDPDTREWYLPESTLSPGARARGVPTYELVGALCDADLFRRLRARAQAEGTEGRDHLVAALHLVRGAPFEQLRRGGYGWLADTPVDHYMTAAIVDVAHIVSTEALRIGDLKCGRWAAMTALGASSGDERSRLDLAAVIEAEEGSDAAQRFLRAAP